MLVALVLPGLLAARPRQLGYSYELDTPGAGVRYRGDISGVVGPSIALPTLNMPSVTTMVRPILRTQFQWFLAELSLYCSSYLCWMEVEEWSAFSFLSITISLWQYRKLVIKY